MENRHLPNLNGGSCYRPLAQAANDILDADLLLFRSQGFISLAIRMAGRGVHSHAAKATWHNGRLMCLEVREFKGGRMVTLASQVAKFPRRIDVFRANAGNRWPDWDRKGSDDYMTNLAGIEYGYHSLVLSALMHIPFVRFLVKPPTDDAVRDNRQPYCSAACAMADDWGGGVDVVPHLANWATAPSDLCRSLFYEYRFTLEP